ncbi:MAG: AsmA family protein [Candidatus Omnitrophica bacterium]|nr:AsmA family protein [Candidatus Omnitrophota bacterium]
MKFLKKLFIVLFVLLVVIVSAFFIAVRAIDINKVAKKIANDLSLSLDLNISVKDVSAEFSPTKGVILRLKEITVEDNVHEGMSVSPFLKVKALLVDVNIKELIKEKKLIVEQVVLQSAEFIMITDKDGHTNIPFEKFSRMSQADDSEDQERQTVILKGGENQTSQPEGASPPEEDERMNIMPFKIKSVVLKEASILIHDESSEVFKTGWYLPVQQLDFDLNQFSLDDQFSFSINASIWSEDTNVRVKGRALLDQNKKQMRIDDMVLESDLKLLYFEKLYSSFPIEDKVLIERDLQGELNITIHQMLLSDEGILVFLSEAGLKKVKTILKKLNIPASIDLNVEITESDINVANYKFDLASGSIYGRGRINEYLEDRQAFVNLTVENISILELLENMSMPLTIEGRIFGALDAQALLNDLSSDQASLKGNGQFTVKDGRIVDVNLFKDMIDLVSQIPGISIKEQLDRHMPSEYKKKLQQKDTIVKNIQVEIRLEKSKVIFTDFIFDAEGFIIRAKGSMDWSRHLEFQGDFYFPKDLSDLMVRSASEFNHFLDDKGYVRFPLQPYSGPAASFKPTLDLKKIADIVVKIGKTYIKKIITDALDFEENEIKSSDDPAANLDQGPESLSPEKEFLKTLIDTVIDKL